LIENAVQKPGHWQPNGDIKYVASDRGGDRHVPEALPCYDDGGDEVGDGGARRQEGQPHHLGRDADGLACDGGPPDHQVGVQGDPDDASEEGYGEELSCALFARVRESQPEGEHDRE